MKVVIAIDSFKGSLSSIMAGKIATAAIGKVSAEVDTKVYPLADGGEGTVDALTDGLDGDITTVEVIGPLGEKITSRYGRVDDTAII